MEKRKCYNATRIKVATKRQGKCNKETGTCYHDEKENGHEVDGHGLEADDELAEILEMVSARVLEGHLRKVGFIQDGKYSGKQEDGGRC